MIKRHTKIIATLGPASSEEGMVAKMASRGMDVARINFSHGTQEQQQGFIGLIRKVNQKYGYDIKLLQDLTGYRIRVGHLKKKHFLEKNDTIHMSQEPQETDDHIPFDYEDDIKLIKRGAQMFIDDGRLQLKVIGHNGKRLKLKVIQGGPLKSKKGINLPSLKLQSNIMTEHDRRDLEFGLKYRFDYVAQSFVRNRRDVQRVIDLVRPKLPDCKVIAKIESEEGLRNIDAIVEACDGVMVARGDLGVVLPLYKIPIIQKYLIRCCNRLKKFSITATQMLDHMVSEGRPTRAEVSDIANAILDGTDYVMLSDETAVGKYPSRSIQVMSQIIEYTEKSQGIQL